MKSHSEQALCAKEVRQLLKEKYPNTKFKVTSAGFSMGDSVSVSWTDGPLEKVVESLLSQFKSGHYDGMQDMYIQSNYRTDIHQTKYLSCDRSISIEKAQRIGSEVAKYYNCTVNITPTNWGWTVEDNFQTRSKWGHDISTLIANWEYRKINLYNL